MIKNFLLAFAFLATGLLFAQENTASPYSFYGVGTNKFRGTNDIVAMGGLTVYSDSIHVNLLNPASYGGQLLTGFAAGGTTKFYDFKTNTRNESAKKTSIDYIYLGLPITSKIGMAVGLMPQTAVGYRFVADNLSSGGNFKQYLGSGGLNNVFIGGGYKINKNFSAGADAQYLFGSIKTSTLLRTSGVLLGTNEIDNATLRGVTFNLAVNYDAKINRKYNFKSNITFSPETNLKSENQRRLSTVTVSSDGGLSESNGLDVVIPNSTLTMPSKLTFGAGVGNKKFFLGADFTIKSASNQLNRYSSVNNVTYKSGSKLSIGGFYIPKSDSFNSYLDRITYRGGFRYESTGMVINNKNISDVAINFGFGFPISNGLSQINLGFEAGSLGTESNGLIKENYFSINIGLLFADKWFKRPLYN